VYLKQGNADSGAASIKSAIGGNVVNLNSRR